MIILSFLLVINFIFHDVLDNFTVHLSIEDLGFRAECDPLTDYKSNDYLISETTESYTQESSDENKFLNSHDLEYDDVNIGMTLFITTVHPGARRCSEPWTSLSLSWRRFVVQSVVDWVLLKQRNLFSMRFDH